MSCFSKSHTTDQNNYNICNQGPAVNPVTRLSTKSSICLKDKHVEVLTIQHKQKSGVVLKPVGLENLLLAYKRSRD